MEQVNVESGIEMPVMRVKVVYPYGEMVVGDSFLVRDESRNAVVKVCTRNKKWGVKLGMEFIAKRVEGGVRVWRVK